MIQYQGIMSTNSTQKSITINGKRYYSKRAVKRDFWFSNRAGNIYVDGTTEIVELKDGDGIFLNNIDGTGKVVEFK